MSDQELREAWRRAQQAGHTIGDVFVQAIVDGDDPAELLVAACRATPERFLHMRAQPNPALGPQAAQLNVPACETDEEGKPSELWVARAQQGRLFDWALATRYEVGLQPSDSKPLCFACTHVLTRNMQRQYEKWRQSLAQRGLESLAQRGLEPVDINGQPINPQPVFGAGGLGDYIDLLNTAMAPGAGNAESPDAEDF